MTTKMTMARGTCQICAREQAIQSGFVVLHGYQRPGDGYTVGRCWGVDHAPFEMGKARLEEFRADMLKVQQTWERTAAKWKAGKITEDKWTYKSGYGKRAEHKTIELCAETFATEGSRALREAGRYESTWAAWCEFRAYLADHQASVFRQEVVMADARLKGWAPHPERIIPARKETAPALSKTQAKLLRQMRTAVANGKDTITMEAEAFSMSFRGRRRSEWEHLREVPKALLERPEKPTLERRSRWVTLVLKEWTVTKEGLAALNAMEG